jgi:hypothetical protein
MTGLDSNDVGHIESAPVLRPLASVAEAESLLGDLTEAMTGLLDMIERETALLRSGRLREATAVAREKSAFAQSYVNGMTRLKASKPLVVKAARPLIESFRDNHVLFQKALQTSLTVLATAHAVSEGLIRGVADEIARKTAPSTYGANGYAIAPRPGCAQPLAFSRAL